MQALGYDYFNKTNTNELEDVKLACTKLYCKLKCNNESNNFMDQVMRNPQPRSALSCCFLMRDE